MLLLTAQSCGSSASSAGANWCWDVQMVSKDTARQRELVAPSCWVCLPQNTAKMVSRDSAGCLPEEAFLAISDFLVIGAG